MDLTEVLAFFFLGSMPPNSHSIFDEGAVFMSFKLVDSGIFQEEGNLLLNFIYSVFLLLCEWQNVAVG